MKFNKKNLLCRGLQSLRWFIPPICWHCGQWLRQDERQQVAYPFVCPACLVELTWSNPEYSCAHCGHQTAEPQRIFCPHCIDNRFHFDQLWSGFHYEATIQQWLLQFKYGRKEHMALLLGRLLSLSLEQYELPTVDGIIPIPLHRKRLQERGFNQALLLTRYSFLDTQICQPYWLRRTRFTTPQVELPHAQRILNLQQAFKAEPQVKGKRLLLVDDVATTGTTLNEAAKTLKEAGALYVGGVVLARKMSPPK